jgi:ATP-dependent Clp protease adapter protein ClpS
MKTKTSHKKQGHPFHLHLERFFRKQYCLYFVSSLLLLAFIKSDGRAMMLMRDAYAQGYGVVGQYMREETTRVATNFDIGVRAVHHSGQ